MIEDSLTGRIRMIRMVKGMNQTTFARQIGDLATSTISAYEKGTIVPPDDALEMIAEIGGVTKEDLLNGGNRFDEVIGNRAAQIVHRRRIRDDSRFSHDPSAGDVGMLIQRLKGFREFIDEVTGKLIKQEQQLSLPILSETEKRLLTAFRALSPIKQKRIVEDTEEWAKALRASETIQEATIPVKNKPHTKLIE